MKKYMILLALCCLLTGCGAPKDTLSINGMYICKKAPADREHLDTTEKVIATLGENYTPADGEKYESFEFEDDKLFIEVTLRNGEFSSIDVTPK